LHLSLNYLIFIMPSFNNSNIATSPNANGTINSANNPGINTNNMDHWRVAVLGDGGVGKTALAVQFTLNCFVGKPAPWLFLLFSVLM